MGVILLELVLSQSADLKQGSGSQEIHVTNDFFTRVIPGFGLDLEKITNAAPSECPFEFLELARDCVDDNPKNRPSIKEVLKRLRKIEQELIKFNDDKANIGVLSESDLKLKFAFSMVDIHSETNSVASSAITSPMSPSPKAMTNNMERSVSTDTDVPLSDFANLDSKNPRPHRFSLIFVLASGKCKVCSQGFRLASRHLVCDGIKY